MAEATLVPVDARELVAVVATLLTPVPVDPATGDIEAPLAALPVPAAAAPAAEEPEGDAAVAGKAVGAPVARLAETHCM